MDATPIEPSRAYVPATASALDTDLTVTFFRDQRAATAREWTGPLRDLVPMIRETRAASKGALPWLKLAAFGTVRTEPKPDRPNSGGSLRHDANVLAIHGVEADYDGEEITLARAATLLRQAGLAAILYTSPSHRPEAPRWRVLCPLSRPHPPHTREALLARLNGLFVGALSRESFALSQSYYYGALDGATSHEVLALDGKPLDAAHDLDASAVGRSRPTPLPATSAPAGPAPVLRSGDGTPYGLAALRNECENIRRAPDGGKHYALVKGAYSIGGLVAAGELLESPARAALSDALAAIRDRCADAKAAEKTLATSFDDGMVAPRANPAPRVRVRVTEYMDDPPARPEPPDEAYAAEFQPPLDYDPETGEILEAPAPAPAPAPVAALEPSPAKAPPLPVRYFADAAPSLDCADFVEGLLIEGAMSVLYGESNSGKTFFVTDLAFHVAAGLPWRDRDVKQGGVLYLAMEGAHGITNRLSAIKAEHGMEDVAVALAYVPITLNLLDPAADVESVVTTVKAVAATMGCPIRLVVVDTLARAIAGGNENSPEDMGALVGNGDRIRQATGAHLLWIHHSGKDQAKGARGHSSLRAATDTEIEVTNAEGARAAVVTKQRELPSGDTFAFTLKVVELGKNQRGKAVTSCVVEVGDGQAPGGASARPRLKGHKQRALEVLADLIATSGQTGHPGTPSGVSSVPDKWWRERFYERAMPGAESEARKKAFQRLSAELVNDRIVGLDRGRVWIASRRFEGAGTPEGGT